MPSSNRDAILKKKRKNKTTNIFCHLDALDVNICNVKRIYLIIEYYFPGAGPNYGKLTKFTSFKSIATD